MKELLIEEKAKRYDEAIEKAKSKIRNDKDHVLYEDDVIEIFPELKGSEDERIRKEMIETLKNEAHEFPSSIIAEKSKSWIAWLEKQGELVENNMLLPFKEYDNLMDSINKKKKEGYEAGYKQGLIDSKSEHKIKPKFKVEDWITDNNSTFQIVRVENKWYYADDGDKICFDVAHQYYHLWTINDAKDGDVLACNEEILLFKSYSVQGRISLYCWYNGQINNFHDKGVTDTLVTTRNKICPATKEQRDLLFQKMKEAGYEWNAEKKELKKIEQISANETPYPETLEKAIDLYYYSYGNGEGEFEHLSLEKFRDIVHIFVSDYGQKSVEWSEEDEKILKAIHNSVDVECLSKNGLDYIVMVDWFKLLKERVQPKQEWSEEDRDLIEEIISHYRHLIAIGSLDSEHYKSYIIPKLKSILSQNH